MSHLPFISCLCPTFGRAPGELWLVGEAVECFLRQDYPAGRRELVILNDTPGQTLTCQAPGVRVFSLPERIRSLGLKRQYLCELAHGTIFLPWDDDDLYLPGHISRAAQRLDYVAATGGTGYWNPQRSWWLDHGTLHSDHRHGVCHNASAFTRAAWLAVGGYPDESVTEDASMDARLRRLVYVAPPLGDDPATWTAVYRWGVSSCHISGGGQPARDWAARGAQRFEPGQWEITPGYTPRTLALLGRLLVPTLPGA